ncbi:hypothetical protein J504_0359 [Acinetobacter baumannii 348935]|nr:hypothetical protein J504_0359 [Acinetobacter baumannii 348935]
MSLGNEMFEWRKQMVEKLLLQGSDLDSLDDKVTKAESVVFSECMVNLKITCKLKKAYELKVILDDFAAKNNCNVEIMEYE